MYKHCNTEESAQRQRQLEQCLLDLMGERLLQQITISDICQKAGISRKSFYRYFDSKEDCLHALLDHVIMDGSTYFLPHANGEIADVSFYIQIFEYWKQQTPLLDALVRNGQNMQPVQRIIRYILEEEPDYARYMGIPEHSVLEHVVFTVSGIMGLVLAWHHEGCQKSPEQMGTLLYQMIQNRKL